MQITIATLDALPGFANLDTDTRGAVVEISRLIDVPGQAVLCRQGSPPDRLHYLLDGQVALTQTAANGEEAVIDVLRPVRGIDLANVVTGQAHQMTARSLTASRLLELRGEPLRTLIGQRPSLTGTMLQGLSLDLDEVTRQVIDLKLRTSVQRLGCYLLRLAWAVTGNRAEFRLPVQKALLAAQLGCRKENLSRAFSVLRAWGVETHGSRVILHDIERLRSYAVPDGAMTEQETRAGLSQPMQAFSNAFSLR